MLLRCAANLRPYDKIRLETKLYTVKEVSAQEDGRIKIDIVGVHSSHQIMLFGNDAVEVVL